MLTTLQLKTILLSYTCQEYARALASLLSKSVYQFFARHSLKLLKRQTPSSEQINQSELSIVNNFNPLQIETIGIPPLKETQTEIMDCFVRVYIPSRDFRGRKINNKKMIREMSELFARLFGGYTRFQTKGGWRSESGQIIEEDITIVESYASRAGFDECLKAVHVMVLDFKSEYRQESVALNINGTFCLL
jgi:hypothetical protein